MNRKLLYIQQFLAIYGSDTSLLHIFSKIIVCLNQCNFQQVLESPWSDSIAKLFKKAKKQQSLTVGLKFYFF